MAGALTRRQLLALGAAGVLAGCTTRAGGGSEPASPPVARPVAIDPRERRLANLRQLTISGQNAEAYFDWTGTRLIFQSTRAPYACDQIFTMKTDGSNVRLAHAAAVPYLKLWGIVAGGWQMGRAAIVAAEHLAKNWGSIA